MVLVSVTKVMEFHSLHILKNSDRWLRRGDHYARVSWTNGKETKRTKAVFQTAKPRFNSDEMSITA